MPYTLPSDSKSPSLLCSLNRLCQHHYSNCSDYKRYIDLVYPDRLSFNSLADIPFLSVNVFKTFSLFSVSQKDIYKVFYSSGTSGYPSKIYLDRPTANYQTKVLSELWSDNISPKRLPFLLIDDQSVISSESPNTARKAAILGFNRFASKTKFVSINSTYCSSSDLEAYFEECSKYETLIVFGFTSFIWNYIHSHSLKKPLSEYFKRIIVLHGGGWKKLQSLNIDSTAFDNDVRSFFSSSVVKSYYGLVEQIGAIFFSVIMVIIIVPIILILSSVIHIPLRHFPIINAG